MSTETEAPVYEEVRLERGYMQNNPMKGADRDERPLAFTGREIGSYYPAGRDDTGGTDWTAYEVEGGKFVLHVKHWSRWDTGGTERLTYVFDDRASLEAFGQAERATVEDWGEPQADYCPEGLLIAIAEFYGEDPAERL